MADEFLQYVKQAQQGDAAAFSKLYAMIYKDMYKLAVYNLRSEQDAEDVISDAVLDAFNSMRKLRDAEAFRGWMMRILTAKIKRKQAEYYKNETEISQAENNLGEDFEFRTAELKEALYSLSDADRLMLSLSVLEGYTSEEIGKAVGKSAVNVRTRLSRMKEALRHQLA